VDDHEHEHDHEDSQMEALRDITVVYPHAAQSDYMSTLIAMFHHIVMHVRSAVIVYCVLTSESFSTVTCLLLSKVETRSSGSSALGVVNMAV
jgi:hypothetical protein